MYPPESLYALRAHHFLQVRVVDKKARGGKIYLKKGVVVDVHPGGIADVRMDENGEALQVRRVRRGGGRGDEEKGRRARV